MPPAKIVKLEVPDLVAQVTTEHQLLPFARLSEGPCILSLDNVQTRGVTNVDASQLHVDSLLVTGVFRTYGTEGVVGLLDTWNRRNARYTIKCACPRWDQKILVISRHHTTVVVEITPKLRKRAEVTIVYTIQEDRTWKLSRFTNGWLGVVDDEAPRTWLLKSFGKAVLDIIVYARDVDTRSSVSLSGPVYPAARAFALEAENTEVEDNEEVEMIDEAGEMNGTGGMTERETLALINA